MLRLTRERESEESPSKNGRRKSRKNGVVFFVLLFSCVFSFGLLLNPFPARADTTTGLVGHWTFSEGSGTTAADSSGSGNNATLFNNPVWTIGPGPGGAGALEFNGLNSYIRMSANAYVPATSSVSFWVEPYASSTKSDATIFSMDNDDLAETFRYSSNPTKTTIYRAGSDYQGPSQNLSPLDTWHNVTIVNNGLKDIYLYIDGRLAYHYTPTNPASTGQPTYIYFANKWYNDYFLGKISNIRLYNRTLTTGDALEIFNEGKSVPTLSTAISSSIKMAAVTLSSSITNDGNASSTDRGFKYGLTTAYGSVASTTGTYGVGSFSAQVNGLTCNTQYHFYAFSTNSVGTGTTTDQTFTTSVCATIVPNGLVGWYKFDDASGATTTDSVDINDGQFSTSPPIWTQGLINGSLKFNGIDSYVRANATAYNTSTSSISFWVKKIDNSRGGLVGIANGAVTGSDWNLMVFITGTGRVGYSKGANYYNGTSTLSSNIWHLVTSVSRYDPSSPSNQLTNLYVDGVLTASSSLPYSGQSSSYLYIGANFAGGPSAYFDGFIDDVRIYNSALTTSDITTIYNAGIASSGAPDVTPPFENQSAPSSILAAGTTQTTLSIITDEGATCKYGTVASTSYDVMPSTFSSTDSLHFSATITLVGGHNRFYVRCQDGLGNTNTSDFVVDVQVYKTCNFSGIHDWYVDAAGDTLNCGTLGDPWDLTTTLSDNTNSSNRNHVIQVGDTVWLHAGSYRTSYSGWTSYLQGSAGNYIIVRPYDSGRAILYEKLTVDEPYVTFRDLEFTDDHSPQAGPTTYPNRATFDADQGVNYPRTGWSLAADNVNMINNLVYGTYGTGASGSDYLYRNILLDIGYYFADGDGADEGMYNHNDYTGGDNGQVATYEDNIISKGVRTGLNMWSAGVGNVRYMHAIDNIIGHLQLNLRSASTLVHDDLVQGNIVASTDSGGDQTLNYSPGMNIGWATHSPLVQNDTTTGNLVINGSLLMNNLVDSTTTNNTIISDSGSSPTMSVLVYTIPIGSAMSNNTYYGLTAGGNKFYVNVNGTGTYSDFSHYLTAMGGLDSTSQFINAQYPSTNQIYYFPNQYEAGRMNIFVANYQMLNSVNLDLSSSGLQRGQAYEIRYIDNYFGPKITGVYNGSAVSLPMNTWSVAQPQFLTDARAAGMTQYALYTNSTPLWGAFVLLPDSTDTTAPTVSLDSPSNGATVSDAVSLSSTATDNAYMGGVTFWYDSTKIGSEITATTSPDTYTSNWNSTSVSNGSHTLSAVARDAAGNYATSSVTVTVDNTVHTYTIGGTISGLSGTVVLQNNSGDNKSISANGSFTFATGLHNADAYSVTVLTQPAGQTCSVSTGSGTVSAANVTSISVACTTNPVTPTPTPVASGGSSGGGGSAQSQVNNLLAMGNYTLAQQIAKQYGITIPTQNLPTQNVIPGKTPTLNSQQSFTRTFSNANNNTEALSPVSSSASSQGEGGNGGISTSTNFSTHPYVYSSSMVTNVSTSSQTHWQYFLSTIPLSMKVIAGISLTLIIILIVWRLIAL